MLLSAEHLSINFGSRQLLEDVNFYLNEGDKVGVIGINGTGKSTFLKVLAGKLEADAGTISRNPNVQVSLLEQNPPMEDDATVLEQVFLHFPKEFRELNEYEAKSMLNKLGLPDYEQKVGTLSGGQRKRVALAAALIHPADVLILDEPTNHLDAEMTAWLEDWLRRFKGGLVMVTHDRYFLERVVNHITELSRGKLYHYEANYSKYLELKAQRAEMAEASERKRQSILRTEREWIMRGCRARTTKSKDRIERYEALKNQDAPETDDTVQMAAASSRLGKKLIELHGVDYRRLPPKELADLLDVLQLLPEHEECVLVLYTVGEEFDAGQPPRRASALYKKLEELVTPLCFEYESESDLCSWVLRHLQASGISASPGDARKIVEFCSKDMFNLSNEVEKLICYTLQKGQKILDPSDIEQVCCGRSIDGAFDFTDALLHGQSERACRLLAGMKEKREKPENILGGVVDTLSGMYTVKLLTAQGLSKEEIASKTGMHSFRVKKFFDATVGKSAQRLAKALELCLSADLQIKSSSLDSYTVLDRLVLRLCRV